jgi:hypothetical protein
VEILQNIRSPGVSEILFGFSLCPVKMEVFPMKDIVINEIYASALISIFEG